LVSLNDSVESGGTGFDPRRRSTCSKLTKPAILSRSANWYQLRLRFDLSWFDIIVRYKRNFNYY